MFDWLESWDWWNQFFGGLKQMPKPNVGQFTTPAVTRPADMPGHLVFPPESPAVYRKAEHDIALDNWRDEEASRLRRLEQMNKLMRSTDIIPGATAGGGFRPLEQRPMITRTAPLDVLDPETKTMADFIRKRDNMFAYKGMV